MCDCFVALVLYCCCVVLVCGCVVVFTVFLL